MSQQLQTQDFQLRTVRYPRELYGIKRKKESQKMLQRFT